MNRQFNQITAIYTRVGGGGTDSSEIISLQENLLTQYAQDHGLDNIRVFSDCGYSGRSSDRPAFQKLLLAIEKNQVSSLVVSSIDRLYRDYMELGYIMEILLAHHGVALHSVRENITPETAGVPFFQGLFAVGGER